MATTPEVPTREEALEELDAAIDQEQVEGTEPAEDTGAETPPEGTEAPAEGEDAEERPETEPPAPAAPAAWQPPPGGQPFRFRADHREVEVPGALEWDHGIYVPKDAWNGVVSRHLADRDGLYQQYQSDVAGLQRQLEDGSHPAIQNHPAIIEARETMAAIKGLFDQGPAAVAQWLDNYAVNRPVLEAQARAKILEQQLQARTQQMTQVEEQQTLEVIQRELPGYIKQNVTALIQQVPELKELAGSEDQVVEMLWPYAKSFLWEADRDYPQYGVSRGQIVARREALEPILRQEAGRRAEIKRLQAASSHNRAALGSAPSTKTVPTKGKPVPAGRSKDFKPGDYRAARDAFLKTDFLADEEG